MATSVQTGSRIRESVEQYVPLLGLLASVLLAGWLLEAAGFLTPTRFGQYQLLFELVLAGFVITTLREEVGVTTYGVFGPVVISFILVGAGPFWGLVLFVNTFVIALCVHRILEPFYLGTPRRIGTLLMVVGFTTAMFLALGTTRGLPAFFDSSRVFFPVIITAWYADHFAGDVDERGWVAPSIRFGWTVVAIVAAYLVVTWGSLVQWMMYTPEAWAALLGANLLLGTTANVRLKELVRFRSVMDGPTGARLLAVLRSRVRNTVQGFVGGSGNSTARTRASDVLPIHVRNWYIERYNPKHLRPSLDKTSMKRTFHRLNIPTPETYMVVSDRSDLDTARSVIESRDEFVIKPSEGYGGEGIVVVSGRTGDQYHTSKGPMTADDLLDHTRGIVGGRYAAIGEDGEAIIEGRLVADEFFTDRCGGGVPDVRVIIFQGYPVMAMARLPTKASDGEANLHKGAVGVGLSISEGRATGAYQQSTDRWLETHPDTGENIDDFIVPDWQTVLDTAVEAAGAARIEYVGVDIVFDEDDGPVVLEINVRPGLGIQNTTLAGLQKRLAEIESLPADIEFEPPGDRIARARELDKKGWEQ